MCRPGHSRVCTVSADRAVSNTGRHQFYFHWRRFFHIVPPSMQDSVFTRSGACSSELPRPCTSGDVFICTLCSCLLLLLSWPKSMSYKGKWWLSHLIIGRVKRREEWERDTWHDRKRQHSVVWVSQEASQVKALQHSIKVNLKKGRYIELNKECQSVYFYWMAINIDGISQFSVVTIIVWLKNKGPTTGRLRPQTSHNLLFSKTPKSDASTYELYFNI